MLPQPPNNTPQPQPRVNRDAPFFFPMFVTLTLLGYAFLQLLQGFASLPPDLTHHNQRHDFALLPYVGAADEDASRGPCPFLNTLANHGYLPQDGRNVSMRTLTRVLSRLGVSEYVAEWMTSRAIPTIRAARHEGIESVEGADVVFDLSDLSVSGFWRVRSLTRVIAAELPPTPSTDRLQHLFAQARTNPLVNKTDGSPHMYLDAVSIAQHRSTHTIPFTLANMLTTNLQCALLLEVVGRGGTLNLEDAESILAHERLPDAWRPAAIPVGAGQLAYRAIVCAVRWAQTAFWNGLGQQAKDEL